MRIAGAIGLAVVVALIVGLQLVRSEPPRPAGRGTIVHRCLDHPRRHPNAAPSTVERFYDLSGLAKQALAHGDIANAETLATELLDLAAQFKDDWNYGNAVYDAHTVLGSVALARGNLSEARRRLLLAAETPGSPQLDSFGPNMVLAQQLLQRGESSVVLQFFQRCRRFWTDSGSLDAWTSDVVAGRMPEFGPNLCY
jgi:hypothetical protein